MRAREPFRGKRFVLALLLAHLAAAGAMGLSLLLTAGVANLFDPDTFASGVPSLSSVAEGAVMLPLLAAALAMPAAILLIPYSLVGALIAWPVVATRCVGPIGASLSGGVVGFAFGALSFWRAAATDGMAERWAFGAIMGQVDAVASGAAFGWVVWRVAIRPWTRPATTLGAEPSTT